MLERVSALAGISAFDVEGLRMAEAPGFVLTQAAGEATALKTAFPKLPDRVGAASEHAGRTMLRIGPLQLWIIGQPPERAEGIALTSLSSSRTRIALEGPRARDILATGAAIDFHPKVFAPGTFAMTGIHHMPVLIHCLGVDSFHIYIMRTFALTLWEVLADAAHS